MKKIGLLVVVFALVLSLCGSAFALDTKQEGQGTSGTAITTITIPKDVVLFNTTAQNIYEPNITFTYSLETQDPGANTIITDKNAITGTVKQGVAGMVTIQGANGSGATGTAGTAASLVFGDDSSAGSQTNLHDATVTTSSKVATRDITVRFDPTVLQVTTGEGSDAVTAYPANAAGIYRYKITDTTAASALTAAGIERDEDYDPIRYLDVYVEWADTAHTTMRVYGWVLYKTDNGTDEALGTTSLIYNGTTGCVGIKVNGYNIESEMLSGVSTSDEYHTYNLTVTKTTTGSMADLNNEVPVAVSFANANAKNVEFYSTGDFANTALALSASGAYSVNSDFAGQPSVKNGDTFTFIGLPAETTYQVGEKNNTADTYKVTILDDTIGSYLVGSATDGTSVAAGSNTGMTTATAVGNLNGSDYESEDVQITNKLESISPTGYIARFAPYAVILIGGLAMLIIAQKSKKAKVAVAKQ